MIGRSCGENMVFQIFSKHNGSCVDKCICAHNFVQSNSGCTQCDWEEDDADDNGDKKYSTRRKLENVCSIGTHYILLTSRQEDEIKMLGPRNFRQEVRYKWPNLWHQYGLQNHQSCEKYILYPKMRMQTQFRGNKWGMHHFIQLAMRQKSKECAKNGKIIRKEMEMRCIRAAKCKLNEIFHELECVQLGHSCGPNMQLDIIDTRPSHKSKSWKCVLQCQCVYGYIEANGRCIAISKNIHERINCMRGRCILNEVVQDVTCSLKGRFCGRNMKFILIKQTAHRYYYNCIVQCRCAEGYKEENGQCIGQHKKTRQHGRTKNICLEKSCEVGMTIHDEGCHLTGENCGKNMIFLVISSGIRRRTYSIYCTQRCSCINSDSSERNSGCEEDGTTGDLSSTTLLYTITNGTTGKHNLKKYIRKEYNIGEEISDLGCRLRNRRCGINKKFITVAEFSAEHDPNIKGCIERCICAFTRPDGCMRNF
ncbi:unnamed protein product [Dracunculus medinensis]|uniref:C2H2-type domain-containing protein n=1 Tax=Dracunculus medinensis TaxID=318479 RepID=A0A158Q4I7_DRAME|nr:unnamed protein product [Dracunculus medinensis]